MSAERRKFGTEPAAKDGISTVKRWATLKAGIRKPESEIRNPECGIRNPKSGMRNAECGMRNPESGIRNIRSPESRNRIPELRMMAEKFTLAINKMSFSLQLQPQTVTVKNMTRFQQQPFAIYPTQFFKQWITLSI